MVNRNENERNLAFWMQSKKAVTLFFSCLILPLDILTTHTLAVDETLSYLLSHMFFQDEKQKLADHTYTFLPLSVDYLVSPTHGRNLWRRVAIDRSWALYFLCWFVLCF